MKTPCRTEPGVPLPLGVYERGDGYNFAVFSRHATGVRLQLFLDARDAMPLETIDLHRSGDIWHVWVSGIRPGQPYAFRADGPYEPRQGHRFNPHKLLLDPNATALAGTEIWDFAAARGGNPAPPPRDLSPSAQGNAARTPKCLVVTDHFDWQGDDPPRRPWTDSIIYESHVRGLTDSPLFRRQPSRNIPGGCREDPVSEGARRDRAGAHARAGVQRARADAARSLQRRAAPELLGL